LHSGYSKSKAIIYNLISASIAFVGVIISLILGDQIEGLTNFIYFADVNHNINLQNIIDKII